MNSDINKYLALQAALINEKAKLEARLNAISKALGQDVSAPAASPAPTAPTTTTTGKRTFSAATRAKMKASQQARWAKKKGTVAVKNAEALRVLTRLARQCVWLNMHQLPHQVPVLEDGRMVGLITRRELLDRVHLAGSLAPNQPPTDEPAAPRET